MVYDLIKKNPAYVKIADITVSTATTSVDIDLSLTPIGKDDELLLVSNLITSSVGTNSVFAYFNSNTTALNYYRQYIDSNGTLPEAGRSSGAFIFDSEALNSMFAISKVKLTNSGYIVWQSNINRKNNTSAMFMSNLASTSTFQVGNISSILLSGSRANGIGTGSRFQLYRLNATKVADIIVPSNTTSVDITGLNIGKGSEYYLVSDVYNPTGSPTNLQVYVNSNTTSTNYYSQLLQAQNTSVISVRDNSPYLTSVTAGVRNFCSTNIKLTNSGYAVYQSNNTRAVTSPSSYLALEKWYGTSTFQTPSITQITITASTTNAIGANSRFTLYKLK